MKTLYDAQAPKRPVNLSVNGDLAAKARDAGINLSAVAEAAISQEFARRARERWDAEIAAACAAHDRYLEEHGSLSDHVLAAEETDASE